MGRAVTRITRFVNFSALPSAALADLISAIVGGMEAIMAVKHLVGIAIATAVAIASAGAVGIGVAEHSATQVSAKRVTPSKAEFRLSDHQRLRKMLLGQEHIVPQR
jgi:hypothetical protein